MYKTDFRTVLVFKSLNDLLMKTENFSTWKPQIFVEFWCIYILYCYYYNVIAYTCDCWLGGNYARGQSSSSREAFLRTTGQGLLTAGLHFHLHLTLQTIWQHMKLSLTNYIINTIHYYCDIVNLIIFYSNLRSG